MISDKAWRELVAALAARCASRIFPDEALEVRLSYEEIESAPDIKVTWDPDLEVVTIEVRP